VPKKFIDSFPLIMSWKEKCKRAKFKKYFLQREYIAELCKNFPLLPKI